MSKDKEKKKEFEELRKREESGVERRSIGEKYEESGVERRTSSKKKEDEKESDK